VDVDGSLGPVEGVEGGGEWGGVKVGEDQAGAVGGEEGGCRGAEAGGGAGYNCYAVSEAEGRHYCGGRRWTTEGECEAKTGNLGTGELSDSVYIISFRELSSPSSPYTIAKA
jgi:hypothetical protein